MTSSDPVRVLVVAAVGEDHLQQIRAVDRRVVVEQATDPAHIPELAARAEVIVGWSLSREALGRATHLRWVHSTAAGVDRILQPEIVEREIVLTTSSGIHAEPITEHVLGMMLAFVRRLHVAVRNQAARRWDRPSMIGEELWGKTLGILGLGHIGRRLADRASAFGMHVIGTRRHPEPVPHVERVLPPEQTDEVLAAADFVTVVLPLTPETRGLIGARELAHMKPTAYLINVGRGAVVQTEALIDALRAGRIAGAGLDVFEREPLPSDSPLFEMEQVILTPHVSGSTPLYYDRAIPLFCENLRRYLAGEALMNVVDPRRGY